MNEQLEEDLPPRVLLVLPDHWHRSLLRAQLRELGYDALGAPDVTGALLYPPSVADRGRVGLVVVDQQALGGEDRRLFDQLLERHGQPPAVLIARTGANPTGQWRRVLTRPVSIAELVESVQSLLPGKSPNPPME